MLKTIIVALALIVPTLAHAGDKMDSLRACQADWKAEKAKADFVKPAKGEGRAAYWTFVKACRPGKTPAKAA